MYLLILFKFSFSSCEFRVYVIALHSALFYECLVISAADTVHALCASVHIIETEGEAISIHKTQGNILI